MTLHPAQEMVIQSKARFIAIIAGRKWGKTKLAVFKSVQEAGKRGSLVWYVAPTYKQARDIAWQEFMRLIPAMLIARTNYNECLIELKNKSIIQLKGTDYEKTLRGAGINFMVLDEAADLASHLWDELLRPNLAATRGGAWFIGTPQGRNWFWKLHNAARTDPDWAAFNFQTHDNPHISREELKKLADTMTPRSYRQEIEAIADETTGIVFEGFTPALHTIPPLETPPKTMVYRSIDWGLHDPTCVLWAYIDEGGRVIIFDEHYQAGLSVTKQASIIKDKSRDMLLEWTVIDPKAFARDPTNFNTVALDFSNNGIPVTRGDNRVDWGINIVQRCFQDDLIRITTKCKNLIREMLKLEWKNTSAGQSEQYVRTDDHATDAGRYLLVKMHSAGLLNKKPQAEEIKRVYPRPTIPHPFKEEDDYSDLFEGTV